MDQRMKKSQLSSLLIFLAAGIVYAGEYFNLPRLKLVVVLGLGVFACINGVRILMQGEAFEGRIKVSNSNDIPRYADLSEMLIGAIQVIIGLMIIGLSLLEIFKPGGAGAFVDRLVSSTVGLASVIALAGIFMAVFGVIRILSGRATSPGTGSKLNEMGIKAGGAITALVGFSLLLLAIWLALSPSSLKDVFGRLLNFF
jgi:hypothetical protein